MNKKIYLILSFVLPLMLYIFTLAPDVMFTDSGELAGVCVNLGIAHSTGYPLFTIIGHIWSLLPLGMSKIYQLNLFSAIATALGSILFFLVSEEFIKLYITLLNNKKQKNLKKDKKIELLNIDDNAIYFISLISSLVLAFGRTIWGQATSIEVYSLQIVFFNLIILFVLKTKEYNTLNKSILFLAFSIGLGFSNHLNTILILPFVFWIYFFGFELKPEFNGNKFKILVILFIPLIIGLSFYLYLPLRSMAFPDFNWGWVHRSWDKFMYHVGGKQYRVWMFSDPESVSKNFGIFISNIPFEFAILGLIFVVLGLIGLFKTRGILISLLIIIASCLFYSLNYSIHDIDNYFILAYIAISMMMVIGFIELYLIIKNKKIIYSIALLPLLSISFNYSESDQSKNYMVSEYTKNMYENLDNNAIIISRQWDYFCSAFWYKQKVEGIRKDVILIEKEILRRTWYIEQLRKMYQELVISSGKEMDSFLKDLEKFESETPGFEATIQQNFEQMLYSFIEHNIDKRPIYVTLDLLQDRPDFEFLKKYNQIPQGFAIKLERTKNLRPIDLSKVQIDKFIKSFKNDNNHLELGIREVASNNITNLGNYSLYLNGDTITAKKAYEMALKISPDNPLALQNYGRIRK